MIVSCSEPCTLHINIFSKTYMQSSKQLTAGFLRILSLQISVMWVSWSRNMQRHLLSFSKTRVLKVQKHAMWIILWKCRGCSGLDSDWGHAIRTVVFQIARSVVLCRKVPSPGPERCHVRRPQGRFPMAVERGRNWKFSHWTLVARFWHFPTREPYQTCSSLQEDLKGCLCFLLIFVDESYREKEW